MSWFECSRFDRPIKNAPTAMAIGALFQIYYLDAAAVEEDFFFELCL
jgi:hypothetical protein